MAEETFYGKPIEELDSESKLNYETVKFGQAMESLLKAWVKHNVMPGTDAEQAHAQFMDLIKENVDSEAVKVFIASAAKNE